MRNRFYPFILILFSFITIQAQNNQRAIAILNLSERNGENNDASLISSNHLIDVVGVPYKVTKDLEEASSYSMIFCTSLIGRSTFTTAEEGILENYVAEGGTLVAPKMENDKLFDLFGVDGIAISKSRYEIVWDSTLTTPALRWIDEAEERSISLGRSSYDEIFTTLGYLPSGAESLAYYPDGTSAIIRNAYGQGQALTIGLSWKDVILRNHINRDFEAQRINSNGFEPTMDVLMLFIRGIYLEYNPFSVWKNTSPGNSKSTLMITHDVDSHTGMDSLHFFVDYESRNNIEATYNITVKYFEDGLSSDFYNNRQQELEYIIDNGHQIQSHSVGHFFDFAEEDIFPKGQSGNTKSNYTPYNDGEVTTGATVFGECEVSKNELEKDFGIDVRTFRAGHLAYPRFLIEVLEELGYEYNSSHSSSDVLTNFPYQTVKDKSFSGDLSNIYEIPVTISDVFHNDPISHSNYLDKAKKWLEVTRKNSANNAPTVLLMHPNRQFKLESMKYYLDGLAGEQIHIMEIGRFGDFWKARKVFDYNSAILNYQLILTLPAQQTLNDNISFIVNNGQDLTDIIVQNELKEKLNFRQENWEKNDVVLYYDGILNSTTSTFFRPSDIKVYPNPAISNFIVEFELENKMDIQLNLFDLNGKKVAPVIWTEAQIGNNKWRIDMPDGSISPGIYYIVLQSESGNLLRKKIVLD